MGEMTPSSRAQDFNSSLQRFLAKKPADFDRYIKLREHIHSHPELSFVESSTAALVAKHLTSLHHFEIHTSLGKHGVVGVLRNGHGPTVLLRADMDALPIEEQTSLPFASRVRQKDRFGITQPVMHACGHDIHTTALLAVAELFATTLSSWAGTLILLFQPAEEAGDGAQAMVDDGLYDRVPVPDVLLGQHVGPARAGKVGICSGQTLSAADSFKITFHGVGAHGSAPEVSVDPIVMAASAVTRLQTIVSREVGGRSEFAVVTVGSFQAGETENVIPDHAVIRVNVRTGADETREKVVAAVKRIVKAESDASRAPKEPTIELLGSFPLTVNDSEVVKKLIPSFKGVFGEDFDSNTPASSASEDFANLALAVNRPYAYWHWGGMDPDEYDKLVKEGKQIAGNHSPFFKMASEPTLRIGVDALATAAMTFLDKGKDW